MLTKDGAIAANRFGLGARPDDSRSIGADAKGWLLNQLELPAPVKPQGAPESARVLAEARDLRVARQVANQARANFARRPDTDAPQPAPGIDALAVRELGTFVREHYMAQTAERHRLAIETDRPFVERLVHFWSNHFAVSADKQPLAALAGLYEQEAIRPHVTGNFYDLLLAAERHPAMILYLDNQASMGPGSQAATFVRRNRGRELGLNENLAREILELHTLGVDGGYTQADVSEFARAITGWGTPLARDGREDAANIQSAFVFRPGAHEPGARNVLGKRYAEGGVEQGRAILTDLARHPATARH